MHDWPEITVVRRLRDTRIDAATTTLSYLAGKLLLPRLMDSDAGSDAIRGVAAGVDRRGRGHETGPRWSRHSTTAP
jgi:hypothetical protein